MCQINVNEGGKKKGKCLSLQSHGCSATRLKVKAAIVRYEASKWDMKPKYAHGWFIIHIKIFISFQLQTCHFLSHVWQFNILFSRSWRHLQKLVYFWESITRVEMWDEFLLTSWNIKHELYYCKRWGEPSLLLFTGQTSQTFFSSKDNSSRPLNALVRSFWATRSTFEEAC